MDPKIPESAYEIENAMLKRALAQVTRKLDDALARLKQLEGGDDVMTPRIMPSQVTLGTAEGIQPHSTIYTPTP